MAMNPVKRTRQAYDFASSFVAGFHPTSLRPMLRANYARELTSWTFMPIMLTGINAGAMGVILKKTFTDLPGTTDSGLALAVGTVGAATAIGNLTSTIWASVSTGRNKVNLIVLLMIAAAILTWLKVTWWGLIAAAVFALALLLGAAKVNAETLRTTSEGSFSRSIVPKSFRERETVPSDIARTVTAMTSCPTAVPGRKLTTSVTLAPSEKRTARQAGRGKVERLASVLQALVNLSLET